MSAPDRSASRDVARPARTSPDPAGAHPPAGRRRRRRPQRRPLPGEPARGPARNAAQDPDRAISTGFAELDALLAAGGLPRAGTVALRGAGSSGVTTLALRAVAEAQAGGALVAWVDLARSLDPVEAVARGVRLEWLAVLVPGSAEEALAMAGALLQARAVDFLVLDLAGAGVRATGAAAGAAQAAGRGARRPRLADQLTRLVAFARRAGALLLVLEPAETPASLRAALDGAGLRLELRRRGWIRLGREVVGQRTEVRVAKDHHGAPDRRAAIRLLYAEGGPRDRCLARDDLLAEGRRGARPRAHASWPPPPPLDSRPPPVGAPGIDRCASSTSPGPISPSGSRGSAIPRSPATGR